MSDNIDNIITSWNEVISTDELSWIESFMAILHIIYISEVSSKISIPPSPVK